MAGGTMANGTNGITTARAILDGRHGRRAILRGAAAMAAALAAGRVAAQAGGSGDLVVRGSGFPTTYAGVRLRDFAVEATFANPIAASVGRWDYGFIFRATDRQRYVLAIDSTGYWTLFVDNLASDSVFRSDPSDNRYGVLPPMRYREGDTNTLRLEVTGRVARLRVNDYDVTALRLDANMNAGDVAILAGLFSASQRNVVVAYTGFGVLDPPPQPAPFAERAATLVYGPANGTLYPSAADSTSFGSTNVALRDGTVGARFFVPRTIGNPDAPTGNWDFGFDLRRTPTKLLRVVVRGDRKWELFSGTKAADAEGYTFTTLVEARDGATVPLRTGRDEANEIIVQMTGATGVLTVNGMRAGNLDLARNTDPGEVLIGTNIGGYSALDNTAAVDFEEFSIAPR